MLLALCACSAAAVAPSADAPRRARSIPPPAFISIAVQMPPKVTLAPSVPGHALTEYGTPGAPQHDSAPRHMGHGGRPMPASAAGTAHRPLAPFYSPMMYGQPSSGLGYGANPDSMLAMMRPMMSMYGGKKGHADVDPNVIPAVRHAARRTNRAAPRCCCEGAAPKAQLIWGIAQVQKMLELSITKGKSSSDLVLPAPQARPFPAPLPRTFRSSALHPPLLSALPPPRTAGQGGDVRRGHRWHGRRARAARPHAQAASWLRAGVRRPSGCSGSVRFWFRESLGVVVVLISTMQDTLPHTHTPRPLQDPMMAGNAAIASKNPFQKTG